MGDSLNSFLASSFIIVILTLVISAVLFAVNYVGFGLYSANDLLSDLENLGYILGIVFVVCILSGLVTEIVTHDSKKSATENLFHSSTLLSFLLISLVGAIFLAIVPQYYKYQIHWGGPFNSNTGTGNQSILDFGIETLVLLLSYIVFLFFACMITYVVIATGKKHVASQIGTLTASNNSKSITVPIVVEAVPVSQHTKTPTPQTIEIVPASDS